MSPKKPSSPRPATPDSMRRRATAVDVAIEAGVSKWTVIRAFKSGASIAEESRRRVMDAAEKLGYRPNLLARSLSTKATLQVAVLVDDFSNPYKLAPLELLTADLQAEQMVTMLININKHFDHANALLMADQRQVDAIVLLGTGFRDETIQEVALHPYAPPLFVFARVSTIETIPSIACDAAASMKEIVDHLWSRGYRRPGFLAGPRALSTVLGRRRHYAEYWKQRGVADVVELQAGHYDRQAAAAAARGYLAKTAGEERIDVLMCENDALAFGAIDVARSEFGLSVPEDLAVAGYDGSDFAAAPAFNLTTYEQPMAEMVRTLIDMLLGRIPRESVFIPGKLIVRGST